MTLVTGGESPKHSKWHLMTGTAMLLSVFVVTMFAVERHIRPQSSPTPGEVAQVDAPIHSSAEPAPIRVASRD